MERIIKPARNWNGLMVKVEASKTWVGEYEVGVYYRGWVGTAFSPDGMGWEGAGFHGTEQDIKAIIQVMLEGIDEQRPMLEKIVTEHAKKTLEGVLERTK